MRRARETAEGIASVTGLTVRRPARLRERLNWDGSLPLRGVPGLVGQDDAGPRLDTRGRGVLPAGRTRLQEFLSRLADTPGPVAAVTHGGVTVDLLRNLLSDDAVPAAVLAAGIPPCAVTAVDDLTVVMIASVSHLPG
jgi:broad specificity phosphatase PhoE